jgi:hypothetical protein
MSFGAFPGRRLAGMGPGKEAAPPHGGATGPRAESCRGLSAGVGGVRRHGPGGGRYGRRGAVPTPGRCADPHGGRDQHAPLCGARPPRGEGPRARDAYAGVIPTGGGTRLTRHSGRGPIARGDDEASKRIIHGPPAVGDPFDKTSRSGGRPSLSVPAIWALCLFCRFRPWRKAATESTARRQARTGE